MSDPDQLAVVRWRVIVNPFTFLSNRWHVILNPLASLFTREINNAYRTQDRRARYMNPGLWPERDQNFRYYIMLPVFLVFFICIGLIVMLFTVMAARRNQNNPMYQSLFNSITIDTSMVPTKLLLEDIIAGKFIAPHVHGYWMSKKLGFIYVNDAGDVLLDDGRKSDLGLANRQFPRSMHMTNSWQMTEHGKLVLIERPNIGSDVQRKTRRSHFELFSIGSWRSEQQIMFRIGKPINKHVAKVDFALFGRDHGQIAIVYERNIYYYPEITNQQHAITVTETNENDEIYNGVTDWKHGFDLWRNTPAMWFSPDGKKLAFMRFNDSRVLKSRLPPWSYVHRDSIAENDTFCCIKGARTAYRRKLSRSSSTAPFRYARPVQNVAHMDLFIVDLDRLSSDRLLWGSDVTYQIYVPKAGALIGDWAVPGAVAWTSETTLVYVWITRDIDEILVESCTMLDTGSFWTGKMHCRTVALQNISMCCAVSNNL